MGKKHLPLLVLMLTAVGLMTVGCDRAGLPDGMVRVAVDPVVHDIMAGQHLAVGQVEVWNDFDYLYVNYSVTAADWYLSETHVHVSINYNNLPQNRGGNPQIGKFAYKTTHDPYVTTYTYAIPLQWEVGQTVAIATHCVLVKVVDGVVVQEETGWAGDKDFLGASWAKWFEYTIQTDDEGEYASETAWGGDIAVNVGEPGRWYFYTTYTVGGDPVEVDLTAGQWYYCGKVNIWEEGGDIKVKFTCDTRDYEWLGFSETHLGLFDDWDDVPFPPQGGGGPIPGQLGHQENHDPLVMEYTYTVEHDWVDNTELYVFSHAVVVILASDKP